MATEGTSLHDGAQCVAAADYSVTGQFLAVYLTASRTLTVDATGGLEIYGILQNNPKLGQACDVVIFGVTKMVAGATVAAGADLMTNASGQMITATSTNHRFGQAIESAVVNQIFTGIFTGSNRTA